MNVSASGVSKILLQVIPRGFSKFSLVKIRHFFPAIAFAFIASTSFGYVREFDNGIPLAWVKDRTVVMQLSLGTDAETIFSYHLDPPNSIESALLVTLRRKRVSLSGVDF